ncbi:NADH-quinone oxidoreductase subunit L [Nitriliruptor alkaliphilus]|uniref:NADH-quinone oxidoreductase subunit L n=1 Tax=Nitriliruptor alkaliphilus TaxID=427918 RepID=UPI001470327A|nr:NADH-quinone oxidoreductase subunit L [Nitriliruptor alkaliphilus]
MEYAWLVVLLPLASTVAISLFGKYLPGKGSELGVLSIGIAFVLSVLIAWETFTNGSVEALERSFDWSPLGGGFVFELGMLVDGLTAMMFLLVTTVSLMVNIYSREYMKGEPRFTYYFAMLSLFTFSMLMLVIANNTLQAIIGWELVGVCSFLLIGFYWEEKSNQDAANKAFLTTKFGDVGLVVGVIVLSAGMFGLTDKPFNILQTTEAASAGELSMGTIVLGMLLIFLGCVAKSGQMPLHVWLPDAMAGPTPVSALIHAATMVTAGIFLLARLYPVVAQSYAVMATIAIVGVITLFFGGLLAVVQDDIKKVLAYSTVSQLGYMMAALGVGGYTAGIFHLFTHGFFKALLFLGSGSLIHAVHSNNMSDMGGMRKPMPYTFWTFIIGTLALAGFPLTAGFFSKDEILVSAGIFAANGYVLGDVIFWIGLLAAFVTTFYMARACFLIFGGESRSHHAPHESGPQMVVPLVVLAVLSLTAGYIGSPVWPSEEANFEQWTATEQLEGAVFPYMEGAAEYAEEKHGNDEAVAGGGLLGGGVLAASPTDDILAAEGSPSVLHGPPSWHFDVLAYALVAFLAALAVAFALYGRGEREDPMFKMGPLTRVLVAKYGFDTFGYKYVVVPVRDKLSPAASRSSNEGIDRVVAGAGVAVKHAADSTYRILDQRVIDGGINGAAFSAAWWSDRLKRIQSGDVQRYAAALVAGVVILVVVFAAGR